jgi:O-antigen ligase
MELVIPISAGYVLSRPKRDPLTGVLWFAVLVPVVSILLTTSRGGVVAVLAEIAILGWIIVWRNPLPGRRVRFAAISLALVAGAVLFLWLAPAYNLAKIGTVNSYTAGVKGGRITVWRDCLGILRDHPLSGTGLGTFVTAFPRYQRGAQDLITEHAHNDYLEGLTETGLLGGVLILGALGLLLGTAFRNLAVNLRRETGWIHLGAAVASCGLLIHSFADFNLHIPANAVWFAFAAAIASLSGHGVPHPGGTGSHRPATSPIGGSHTFRQ